MMRALYNTSGYLDRFVDDRFLSGVTSHPCREAGQPAARAPEADGGQSTHSGLADSSSDHSSSPAVRQIPEIAPLPFMGGAQPAGGGSCPCPQLSLPAGDLSDDRGAA